MRTIVVPVNFTANSANAVRYAADLAFFIGANIHLINDSCEELPVSLSDVDNPFLVVTGALRRLRYPLLVIPEHTKFKPVNRIVIACDQEDIFSGMFPWLSFLNELSTLLNARLEVLHVLKGGDAASEAIADYNVWKREVMTLCPELHFIHRPTVVEGITDYLKEHPADWLMVFPKTHSVLEFHRSRAKQIVLHCTLPVLSLHE